MTSGSAGETNGGPAPIESTAMPQPDDPFAAGLRGFGPLGLLAILAVFLADAIVKPLGAILVLLWARLSHTPWREIGYVRPGSWIGELAAGIAVGVAFKLLMKAMVMPLLVADPVNHAYHYLAGNAAALPWMLFVLVLGAGFGEETVYRGFLFERLGKLIGSGSGARVAIVLLTSVLFALAHYSDQGLAGAEQAMITGLAFGTIFAVAGRIWMLMWMHAAFDVTALAIIYWDLEYEVAHLFDR
jgi:CAAX protease family protein